jgi:hypothetical protein
MHRHVTPLIAKSATAILVRVSPRSLLTDARALFNDTTQPASILLDREKAWVGSHLLANRGRRVRC